MPDTHAIQELPNALQPEALQQSFAELGFRAPEMAFYLDSLGREYGAQRVLLSLSIMYLEARADRARAAPWKVTVTVEGNND